MMSLWSLYIYITLAFLFISNPIDLFAQAPQNIQAQDNAKKRIRITWKEDSANNKYVVYRSPNEKYSQKKPLLNLQGKEKILTTPYAFDGSSQLQVGKIYYYWVESIEQDSNRFINPEQFDTGFLAAMANNNQQILPDSTSNSFLGQPRSEIKIEALDILSDTIAQNEPLTSSIQLLNKGLSVSNRIYLHYYLSKDSTLNEDDLWLYSFYQDEIASQSNVQTSFALTLDKTILSGTYFLFIVLNESDGSIGGTEMRKIVVDF